MKNRLASFFKRWTKLYNFLKRGSLALSRIRRRLSGTKLDEEYWATRHLRKGDDWGKNDDWIRGYWDSRDHSHRGFLTKRIFELSPSSILEIGCNCGPNLYILAKKFPDAKIKGIDINLMAVQKGNEWFRQECISNVDLSVGKADELKQFQDKSFDVVFTDAVLIYIGPDKIKKVIEEMLRITCKALIFLEWHCFDSKCSPLGVYMGHWVRDYRTLLKEFLPEDKITLTRMPKELWPDQNWQKWGGIVEVLL